MDDAQSDSKEPGRKFSIWRALPWCIIPLAIVGIVFFRITAVDDDFAKANILTVLLGMITWATCVAGLYVGNFARHLWKIVFWTPVILLGATFALFRFERLDGELMPQFTARWTSPVALPEVSDQAQQVDAMFVSRSTDFPQFLGPTRDGVLNETGLDFDWSSNPPEVVWKQPIGDGWSGFAVQGDVAVTMEQRDNQELVSAYSILDGTLLWAFPIDALHKNVAGGTGPRCTPMIANNRVYAVSAVSQAVCLDLLSGEKIWTQELLKMAGVSQADFEGGVTWGRAGSPLVIGNQVLLPFGGSGNSEALISFSAETGEELWRSGKGQVSYSSPVQFNVMGTDQVLLFSENELGAYSASDGTMFWTYPWPGHSNADPAVSQPVQVAENQFFISKGYGTGSKLIEISGPSESSPDTPWSAKEVWKSAKVLRTKFTNCVRVDDHVYGLSDGILECVRISDGKREWKKGRYRHGQLLLVDGNLIISAENGNLVLVPAKPDKYEELFSVPVIGDVTWNTLTLSGDRLLIRNSDESACVRLPRLNDETATENVTDDNVAAGEE